MQALRAQRGTAARALELLILTASRTHVVLAATWAEIDFEKRLWTVLAARMKTAREHRIPLSARALTILTAMDKQRENDYVFPGRGRSGHLSVLGAPLKWMQRTDITVHGFRSTFRDWAAETTNHPSEVAEMALAHAVGDKVEAAYRRGDLMEKRRQFMDDWARYCAKER